MRRGLNPGDRGVDETLGRLLLSSLGKNGFFIQWISFAYNLLCFVVVCRREIHPYPSGLLHRHRCNQAISQCQRSNPEDYG